ncbi:SGNH/GDSL hydrolase family protein [Actinophytocola sediminis]
MRTAVRAAAAALAILLVTILLASGEPRRAEAAPLSNSTWCAYKDSLALLGGSSGTGYLTAGYSSADGTYDPTTYGWWKRVAERADSAWGAESYNYSRNGASAASYLPGGRWPSTTGAVADIGAHQPALAIISLGTNEYLAQVQPGVFEANLRQLVDDIQTISPRTAILLAVQWTARVPSPTYSWEQYKQRIQAVAVSEITAMVDLRQYLPSASDPDWAKFYHPDRIHLLDHSHLVVAAAFWTWLFSC